MTKYLIALTLFIIPVITQAQELVDPNRYQVESNNQKLELLNDKIEFVEKINTKTLNSVYWTLGILASIFLGLISVNLYFNFTGYKNQIEKNRQQVLSETSNQIASAENRLIEKMETDSSVKLDELKRYMVSYSDNSVKAARSEIEDKINQKILEEVEKIEQSLNNLFDNKILNSNLELRESLNAHNKEIVSDINKIRNQAELLKKRIEDTEVNIKELEVFKYSQENKQGALINLIELLDNDIKDKTWKIPDRLEDIKKQVDGYLITPSIAADLKKQLMKLDNTEHKDVIDEIRRMIKIDK